MNNKKSIINWIPCSKELPKEDGFYTVTKMTKNGLRYVAYGVMFSDDEFKSKRVIAWADYFDPYDGEI